MTRTKVVVTLVLAIPLVLAGTRSGSSPAFAATPGGQVTICHFQGHSGGPFDSDLVTSNLAPHNYDCVVKLGGQVITVGVQACENGHRALPWPDGKGRDCALGNLDD